MSEKFTFYRFGDGEHPYPGLYALYLSDVLYQDVPWANSANIEFYSMSGLGGGSNRDRAAPAICPGHGPSPDATKGLQAIYFVGLRPLAMQEFEGHAVVVVEDEPGVLHKILFERPLHRDKGGADSFDRLDAVTTDGRLRFVQSGLERWQAAESGAVEFASIGADAGELPSDLPLPDPFTAYDGVDPAWVTIRPGFRPAGAVIGHLIENPLHVEVRMLFLPAGSEVPYGRAKAPRAPGVRDQAWPAGHGTGPLFAGLDWCADEPPDESGHFRHGGRHNIGGRGSDSRV
jgi:hypothetical protein